MNKVNGRLGKNLFWLSVFAMAMGLAEAVIVVYLRQLYFPGGFSFPLQQMPSNVITFETIREICTLLMLSAVAMLIGKNRRLRLAGFLFMFGIWDLFYYLGLKVFLNWPESLFTFDVLFLIPVPWVAPVLAPLICSAVMIIIGLLLYRDEQKNRLVSFSFLGVSLGLAGILLILASFIKDFLAIIFKEGLLKKYFTLAFQPRFKEIMAGYVPGKFTWWLFALGLALIAGAIIWQRVKEK